MTCDSIGSRRDVLRLLAAGAAVAAGARQATARETHIERLIYQARAYPQISQRIDFISAALRGTRYLGYTLIGGPRRPEKFVVRDDGFDCVTYCETVLAAADCPQPRRLRDRAQKNPLSQWRGRVARAQSLFLRMVPAQCRERNLPLDQRWTARSRSRKPSIRKRA